MHENYQKADPDFNGIVTVPALWDKKRQTIVNNESSEIIRMFNSAFNAYGNADLDFYPEELRTEIDAIIYGLIPASCTRFQVSQQP